MIHIEETRRLYLTPTLSLWVVVGLPLTGEFIIDSKIYGWINPNPVEAGFIILFYSTAKFVHRIYLWNGLFGPSLNIFSCIHILHLIFPKYWWHFRPQSELVSPVSISLLLQVPVITYIHLNNPIRKSLVIMTLQSLVHRICWFITSSCW